MNNVMLVGRLTKDVEVRMTTSGKNVCRFSLAIRRDYKNQNGEYEADFINCIMFGQSSELLSKYTKKGDMLGVKGHIQTSSYEAQDGTKKYTTDVVVEKVTFLNMNNKKEESNVDEPTKEAAVEESDPFKEFAEENEFELPF